MAISKTKTGYKAVVTLGVDERTNKKIRKSKTFSPVNRENHNLAKAWEVKTKAEYKSNPSGINMDMYVDEYMDFWYDTYVVHNTKYQTQKRYKTQCNHIKKYFKGVRLKKLKSIMIEKFYTDLKQEMVTLKNGATKRKYKDGTVLKIHRMFRQSLDKAVGWELLDKNPADFVTAPEDDTREVQYWLKDETDIFFNLIKNEKVYLPAFIAYHTGLREGEVAALLWENVDLAKGIIYIKYNMVQKGKELVLEEPKTESSKDDVVMTNSLIEKLKEVKAAQEELTKTTGIEYDYVCCWEDGRPLRPLYITKSFTKLVDRYKRKKITFHGLRHSHATILYLAGASSQEISKRLRHSRVSTTDDIYIHITEDVKKETASIFERAIEAVTDAGLNEQDGGAI